jgi:hypothetical protein
MSVLRRGVAIATLTVTAFAGLASTTAWAGSAHFIGTPTDSAAVSAGGTSVTLSATFKAAGLGNVSSADFSLQATATGTFGCFTKNGNHPQASNKEGPVVITGTTTVPVRNGSTKGTVSATLGTDLSCPGGQHVAAISWTFTNVTLSGPDGLQAGLADVSGP